MVRRRSSSAGCTARALGLGLYSATRRAYLAELHDRAARLERERDQQGALAAAAERARIAREMHDIVAHNLTVMVTLSEAAARRRGHLAGAGRRGHAQRCRPPGGARWPTPAACSACCARSPAAETLQPARRAGPARRAHRAGPGGRAGHVTLEISGPVPDLPEGVQLTVYRLVQEALTNTLKHAGAGATRRGAPAVPPGELRVEVDDDGAGRRAAGPAPAAAGRGGGLLGMRERVRAVRRRRARRPARAAAAGGSRARLDAGGAS